MSEWPPHQMGHKDDLIRLGLLYVNTRATLEGNMI
jgi:hypothetical protein